MRVRRPFALLAAACSLALTTAVAPMAAHADHGGPSAGDVAASKARVAELERQVRTAADAVAHAQSTLDQLRTQAEVAVEAFDKAQVVRTAAQRSLAAAQLVLSAAQARVSDARSGVARFSAAAYEGGALSSLDVLLSAQGPEAMLYRLSALDAVSRSQRDVVEALSAATVYQHVVQQQASEALLHARAAAEAAARARQRAQHLVAVQTAAVTRLASAQHHLAQLLHDAQAHASAVERARLAALARARAQAAAAERSERLERPERGRRVTAVLRRDGVSLDRAGRAGAGAVADRQALRVGGVRPGHL